MARHSVQASFPSHPLFALACRASFASCQHAAGKLGSRAAACMTMTNCKAGKAFSPQSVPVGRHFISVTASLLSFHRSAHSSGTLCTLQPPTSTPRHLPVSPPDRHRHTHTHSRARRSMPAHDRRGQRRAMTQPGRHLPTSDRTKFSLPAPQHAPDACFSPYATCTLHLHETLDHIRR